MKRKNLITYTADDFGYSHQTNVETIKLAKKGEIARISLLVNFPHTKEAVASYKKDGLSKRIPIGLHFNIIEGKNYSHLLIFLTKLLFKKIKEEDLKRELKKQIKTFQDFGLELADLNSHGNIHFFAPVDKIFLEAAREYHIPYIRQKSSSLRRLKRYPARMVFFHLYSFLNRLAYKRGNEHFKSFEEEIIHPGTNFDK